MRKEYIICSEATTFELANEVFTKLKDGWQLYGDPFFANDLFHQAVIRE